MSRGHSKGGWTERIITAAASLLFLQTWSVSLPEYIISIPCYMQHIMSSTTDNAGVSYLRQWNTTVRVLREEQ
jgi:hypothetical protein